MNGMLRFVVAIMALNLGSCSASDDASGLPIGECVVLLHGLARSSQSMESMARALKDGGFHVANVDYASREHPIEYLAPIAVGGGIRECESQGKISAIHFVTHSLGGILVRYYFADNHLDGLGRVVMLAPPNQGSNAVDALRNLPGYEWLNGPVGYQLGKGEESVPLQLGTPDFEFAVIAGDRSIDPVTSAVLKNPDDGRVSVSDTRLDGMRDFRVVGSSHAFIMQNDEVFALVKNFLRHGSFDDK